MADTEVKVVISGEAAGAIAAIQQTAKEAITGFAEIKEAVAGMTEVFAGAVEGFLGLAAAFAGGAALKGLVDETKNITREALTMGKQLGESATEASEWNVALEQIGVSSDDAMAAARGLTRQLKTNEDGLNDLGIKTRDASGNFLDFKTILLNAVETVNEYQACTDRNLAAQTAFGRGVSATSTILRASKESFTEGAEEAEKLGLVVGQQNVEAYAANKAAVNGATAVMHGMEKAIGDALLPVLTELANWFRDIGPAAIVVLKGSVGGIVSLFWVFKGAVEAVGQIVAGVIHTIIDTLEDLFEAAGEAMQGHWAKAGAALKMIGTDAKGTWGGVFDDIVNDAKTAGQKMFDLFAEQDPTKAPKKGKAFKPPEDEEKGPDNRLALYKNALQEMNQARGDFDGKDIAADRAYWAAILANTTGGTKEDEKLRTEIQKEILALDKKQHDEEMKIAEEASKEKESLALGEIDAKRTALQQQLAMGQITQQQELAGEMRLENERFAIQQRALQEKLQLAQFDLLEQQKLKDQELTLEQKHAADVLITAGGAAGDSTGGVIYVAEFGQSRLITNDAYSAGVHTYTINTPFLQGQTAVAATAGNTATVLPFGPGVIGIKFNATTSPQFIDTTVAGKTGGYLKCEEVHFEDRIP